MTVAVKFFVAACLLLIANSPQGCLSSQDVMVKSGCGKAGAVGTLTCLAPKGATLEWRFAGSEGGDGSASGSLLQDNPRVFISGTRVKIVRLNPGDAGFYEALIKERNETRKLCIINYRVAENGCFDKIEIRSTRHEFNVANGSTVVLNSTVYVNSRLPVKDEVQIAYFDCKRGFTWIKDEPGHITGASTTRLVIKDVSAASPKEVLMVVSTAKGSANKTFHINLLARTSGPSTRLTDDADDDDDGSSLLYVLGITIAALGCIIILLFARIIYQRNRSLKEKPIPLSIPVTGEDPRIEQLKQCTEKPTILQYDALAEKIKKDDICTRVMAYLGLIWDDVDIPQGATELGRARAALKHWDRRETTDRTVKKLVNALVYARVPGIAIDVFSDLVPPTDPEQPAPVTHR